MPKKISVILIGAGSRGMGYARQAKKFEELYDIVAIRRDPSCYKDTDLYKAPMNYCHNNYTIDGAGHGFADKWIELSDHENNVDIPAGENPFFVNPTLGDYTVVDGADLMDNHFELIGRY